MKSGSVCRPGSLLNHTLDLEAPSLHAVPPLLPGTVCRPPWDALCMLHQEQGCHTLFSVPTPQVRAASSCSQGLVAGHHIALACCTAFP